MQIVAWLLGWGVLGALRVLGSPRPGAWRQTAASTAIFAWILSVLLYVVIFAVGPTAPQPHSQPAPTPTAAVVHSPPA